MIAQRSIVDGRPRIAVNGELLDPVAFMTYFPNARNFAQFRDIGTRFFSFGAYATDYGINDYAGMRQLCPHFWIGDGQYDFTEIDRVLSLIAPDGQGAYVFPRVYLDCPKRWARLHPDELCMDNRGETLKESFASEQWRQDAWVALRALIDHIAASPWRECVVGYHIAAGATEEWTYHHHNDQQYRLDYSEPNRRRFIEWLQAHYGTLSALNAAWHTSLASFEDVSFPSLAARLYATDGVLRDPRFEQRAVDFWAYTSDLFADTILYFCQQVKTYTHNTVLTGAFYGYVTMLTRSEKGHYALNRVLNSPDIDFIATTNGGSEPGQSWPFGSAVDSVRLHGKLFFAEGDVRTCLSRPMGDTLPHAVSLNHYYKGDAWKPLESMELTVSALKKACARVLTGHTGVWWFDMFGGWFDAPECMDLFARFQRWMREQTETPLRAEIAIIIDEDGLRTFRREQSPAAEVIGTQRMNLSWLGAPTHTYLADDLTRDDFPVADYRLYLFLNLVRPSSAIRKAIEEKIKGGGRMLVFPYLTDTDTHGALAGFDVRYDATLPPMRATYGSERFAPICFPERPISCPRFAADAMTGAYALARFENTLEPCVLLREETNYTLVYSLLPALPHTLLSDLAMLANVHLYARTGDVIYAGGRFVGIHAYTEGEKRIYLPFPAAKLYDAETGREMPLHNGIYADFPMRKFETRLFRLACETPDTRVSSAPAPSIPDTL